MANAQVKTSPKKKQGFQGDYCGLFHSRSLFLQVRAR